ncbi:MAG: hypothetical protein ACYC7A_22605 [Thermoanaerobaculia bacterium]
MLRILAIVAALAGSACAMPERDRAWVDRALEAWRFTSAEISGIDRLPEFQAIFFSGGCVMRSANALTSPTAEGVTWSIAPHEGTIALPDGGEVPVGVTSFASGEKEGKQRNSRAKRAGSCASARRAGSSVPMRTSSRPRTSG